jgi:hypothetical protein
MKHMAKKFREQNVAWAVVFGRVETLKTAVSGMNDLNDTLMIIPCQPKLRGMSSHDLMPCLDLEEQVGDLPEHQACLGVAQSSPEGEFSALKIGATFVYINEQYIQSCDLQKFFMARKSFISTVNRMNCNHTFVIRCVANHDGFSFSFMSPKDSELGIFKDSVPAIAETTDTERTRQRVCMPFFNDRHSQFAFIEVSPDLVDTVFSSRARRDRNRNRKRDKEGASGGDDNDDDRQHILQRLQAEQKLVRFCLRQSKGKDPETNHHRYCLGIVIGDSSPSATPHETCLLPLVPWLNHNVGNPAAKMEVGARLSLAMKKEQAAAPMSGSSPQDVFASAQNSGSSNKSAWSMMQDSSEVTSVFSTPVSCEEALTNFSHTELSRPPIILFPVTYVPGIENLGQLSVLQCEGSNGGGTNRLPDQSFVMVQTLVGRDMSAEDGIDERFALPNAEEMNIIAPEDLLEMSAAYSQQYQEGTQIKGVRNTRH